MVWIFDVEGHSLPSDKAIILAFNRAIVILLLVFLLAASPLTAQRVAVVLSGGGSDGLAHIGMLKVLEQHQIPVD
jgi:chemotaxis response regulator CheB